MDSLQEEIENLRRTLEQQRAHSSQAIQDKEMSNKLLREQFEQTQLRELNTSLAADVNMSDPNWNQPFAELFPGPEKRKESNMATTPGVPADNSVTLTVSELNKQMKQTARDAIKEYESAKEASALKQAQTYQELHNKFMTENPDMVPHAAYLNDVFHTLSAAPKDPVELYNYTLDAAKKSLAYSQQLQQQQQATAPRNPYSTAGLGNSSMDPIQRYQNPGQVQPNSVLDPRSEEQRLSSAASETAERRKAYFKQGVG